MRPILPSRHPRAPARRRRAPGRPRPGLGAGAARQPRRARHLRPALHRGRRLRRGRRRRHRRRCSRTHGQLHRRARTCCRCSATRPDLAPGATAALARAAGAGLAARAARPEPAAAPRPALRAPAGAGCATLRRAGRRRPGCGRPPARRGRCPGLRRARRRRRARPGAARRVDPRRDAAPRWCGSPRARAVVGPFVVPGTTACLRCVDAHRTDADPAWPLLVAAVRRAARPRPRATGCRSRSTRCSPAGAGLGGPRPGLPTSTAAGPSTWSATVTLHPRLSRAGDPRLAAAPGLRLQLGRART